MFQLSLGPFDEHYKIKNYSPSSSIQVAIFSGGSSIVGSVLWMGGSFSSARQGNWNSSWGEGLPDIPQTHDKEGWKFCQLSLTSPFIGIPMGLLPSLCLLLRKSFYRLYCLGGEPYTDKTKSQFPLLAFCKERIMSIWYEKEHNNRHEGPWRAADKWIGG